MESNPEILDVGFWFDDGFHCGARLGTVKGSFESLRPQYEFRYLLDKDTPKSVIPAIERYLHLKQYELSYFWLRAAVGVIGLGIILGLFLIL
jgi:hypothetical protein